MKTENKQTGKASVNFLTDKQVNEMYNKIEAVEILASDYGAEEVQNLTFSEKRKFLNEYFEIEKGMNLFETPELIPDHIQNILDKYENDFMDGNYKGLSEALSECEAAGYTFEYYLDGVAYDLRPIGTPGKVTLETE